MSSNQQLPPIHQMAINLTKTAGLVTGKMMTCQSPFVEDSVSNDRLNICQLCEFFIKDDCRCSKCGCAMQFKVRFNGAKCPVDKW